MDIIKDFDRALKVMKHEAAGKPELMKEVEALEAKRQKLIEAVLTRNTRASMDILKEAFRVESRVHEGKNPESKEPPEPEEEVPEDEEFALTPKKEEPEEKPVKKETKQVERVAEPAEEKKPKKIEPVELPWKTEVAEPEKTEAQKKTEREIAYIEKTVGELTRNMKLPEEPEKVEKELTLEEEADLEEERKKRLAEIEGEFNKINEECTRIKDNWKNIDDIKGDYSDLTDQIKGVRKDVEKLVEERKRVNATIKELKEKLNEVHNRKNKEFGMTKDAYKYFWNELLMVSVKLSEIEDLFDKNERVTDMDLLELKTDIESLEKKLGAVEWVAAKKTRKRRKKKRQPRSGQ